VQRRIARYITRGYLANWRRQLQDGTREYRKALKLDPHDDGIKFALGVAAVHKRDALAALERRPDDIKSLSKLGYIAWNEQDYGEAIRRFRQVLALDAQQASAYVHLGVSYAAQENFAASIAAYRKAKDLRADLAGVVGQSIDLVERLRRAREHPNDPAVHARLGELYASDRRFDRAIECFEKATALAPDSPEGLFTLARYYEAEERDLEALRAYDRGLALDPTNAQARNNREKLSIKRALELGKPVALALGPDGPLTIDPDSATSYYQLGLRYLRNDEADAAVTALRRAVTMQPGHDAAHLFLGLAYTSLGTYADAEVEYRRAIALRPTNPEAYNYLGLVYYQQQRYRQALSAYRQAIAQAPGYAVAYVNLAASHEALGQSDAAPGGLEEVAPGIDFCQMCLEQERARARTRAVLTTTGRNQKGIVARVTAKIAELGGDILDISQTLVADYFTMIIIIDMSSLEVPFTELKSRLTEMVRALGAECLVMHEDVVGALQRI